MIARHRIKRHARRRGETLNRREAFGFTFIGEIAEPRDKRDV